MGRYQRAAALGRSRPISVAMAERPFLSLTLSALIFGLALLGVVELFRPPPPRWWRGGVLLLLALVLAIAGRPWLKL